MRDSAVTSVTDYDRTTIPATYDRGRDHGPEVVDLWMTAIAAQLERAPVRILDLGCGTGRFSDALAVRFQAEVIGLDPSALMLAQALGKARDGRVRYGRARAEALPLPPSSIDVVFVSMSLHHFGDHALAASECRRVLREDGRVFIRTGSREQMKVYPYYPFFPGSHAILERVLPDCAAIRQVFEASGLAMTSHRLITQTISRDWATYIEKLAAGADSVLAQLDPGEFAYGLTAMRKHARRAVDAVVEPIDLLVFRRV